MKNENLASRRYLELVAQLSAEEDGRYGWKSRVARRLGAHPSYLSKVIAGEVVGVGLDMCQRAAESLGISQDFFSTERDGTVAYRDFLLSNGETASAKPTSSCVELRVIPARNGWAVHAIYADSDASWVFTDWDEMQRFMREVL